MEADLRAFTVSITGMTLLTSRLTQWLPLDSSESVIP